jgi:hypothetical protein
MIIKPVRRYVSEHLFVRTGLMDWLADRVLPTEYRVTGLLATRLRENGLRRDDMRPSTLGSGDNPIYFLAVASYPHLSPA